MNKGALFLACFLISVLVATFAIIFDVGVPKLFDAQAFIIKAR